MTQRRLKKMGVWRLGIRCTAAALLAACAALATPQPAACGWCPTYTCYGPCGGECICLSQPGTVGGRCYGVNGVPALVARGWRVVP